MAFGPRMLVSLSDTPHDFLWIVVLGAIICFLTAFAIGANDVANTFSSSVGSKAIPLPVAIAMAAVLETAGATLLGAAVTDSIRSKIIGKYYATILQIRTAKELPSGPGRTFISDFSAFEGQPSLLMLGMMCSLLGAGIWLFLANRFGLPVSTTHSIIGALTGFGLASGNIHAIKWTQIGFIVASWLIAPLAASLVGATMFLCMRTLILRSKHPLKRAISFLWFFIWLITVTFSAFLVLRNPFEINTPCNQWIQDAQAVQNVSPCRLSRWSEAHMGPAIGIAFGISVVLTAIISGMVYTFAFYRLRHFRSRKRREQSRSDQVPDTNSTTPQRLSDADNRVHTENEVQPKPADKLAGGQEGLGCVGLQPQASAVNSSYTVSSTSALSGCQKKTFRQKLLGVWRSMPWFKDIHAEGMDENEFVERLQNDVEMFDVETEIFFSACQVVSACMGCIAHSANDTANAVGPFAAILTIYQHGISSSVTCPWYILLFGGIAMSLGLALLGYRVIKTVGVKLVKITPARGFSMELGAAWTVLIFSAIGIPLSTTHCAVGSTVGVGLLEPQEGRLPFREGIKKCPLRFPCLNTASVNWKLFGGMIASWIVTILFSAVVSASLFSFAAYSPRVSI